MVLFYKGHTIDSVTLAQLLGKGHETVCTFEWIRTPCRNLSQEVVEMFLPKDLTYKQVRVIMDGVYNMLPERWVDR